MDRPDPEFEHLESGTKIMALEFAKQLRDQGGYAAMVLADYIEGDITGVLHAIEADTDQSSASLERHLSEGLPAEQKRKKLLKAVLTLQDKRMDFATIKEREQVEEAVEKLAQKRSGITRPM